MTGRRLKLIALQAVVVGALLIVVSLTLLRGEEGNPLFDIVAPGAAEISVGTAQPEGDPGGPGQDRPGAGASAGATGGSAAAPPLAPDQIAPPDPTAPADSAAPGAEDEDPTGDQYADTLARLTQQLQ